MYILEKAIYSDLTTEEILSLSDEEKFILMSKPSKEKIKESNFYMKIRVIFFVSLFLWYGYKYSGLFLDLIFPLMIIVFSYEFAYYNILQKKLQRDFEFSLNEYLDKINNLYKNYH